MKAMQERTCCGVKVGKTCNYRNKSLYKDSKNLADKIQAEIEIEQKRRSRYATALEHIVHKIQKTSTEVKIAAAEKVNKIK